MSASSFAISVAASAVTLTKLRQPSRRTSLLCRASSARDGDAGRGSCDRRVTMLSLAAVGMALRSPRPALAEAGTLFFRSKPFFDKNMYRYLKT